ncbi:MAG: hypothetical protein KDH97_05030 [Calditrichaeota bacterium]|nr:hypothetical protein [Calditrichota bacterium]
MKQMFSRSLLVLTLLGLLSNCTRYNAAPAASEPEDNARIEKSIASFLMALQRKQNDPLVESAMFHVLKLKCCYPQYDYSKVSRQMDVLALNAPNPTIRYQAYLAGMFLREPTWQARIEPRQFQDSRVFFAGLNEVLQENLLGDAGR